MEDCIFCKIVAEEIPAVVVYENERVVAFEDIEPMAPVHVIVIPKEHVATVMDITADHADLMVDLMSAVQEVVRIKGIDKSGFRVVINCNQDGGQIVFHLHIHILGGRKLQDGLG